MIRILFLFLFAFFTQNCFGNQIDFTIALNQNNMDILKNKLLDISDPYSENYGKFMSNNEIMDIIKPSFEHTNSVINWLNYNNITNKNYGDAVKCKGNVTDIERMFDISLNVYNTNNKTYYYSDKNYIIPDEFKNIIVFVEGFRFNKKFLRFNSTNNINVDPGYVSREVIQKLYNISEDTNLSMVSGASIEYQGQYGFSQQDLIMSQKENGEIIRSVKNNNILGNNSNPDLESQLDMQMISQTAENIELWFWGEENWLYSFAVDFFNHKTVPDVISMSYGWSEDQQCTISNCTNITSSQYIDRVNNEYVKIGLRGITITVSSGDAGAPGRTSEQCNDLRPLNPVFPGSSPWVTSVGATFVKNNGEKNKLTNFQTPFCKNNTCASSNEEYPTNFNYTGWTAGGGFSIYQSEITPKWQKKSVNEYINSGVKLPTKMNKNGRAYPDVSSVGHNCPVFSSGSLEAVDGTSCSSPIFAGIVSILNQHQIKNGKPKLGFINPLLYKMVETANKTFNDITDGFNWCTELTCCSSNYNQSEFGYKGTIGYDPVSGLGTPNVGNIFEWLDSNTKSY